MVKIYWSHKQFVGAQFKGDEHEGKYCVLAYADKGEYCIPMTSDEKTLYKYFDTYEESIFFINEGNKPVYYAYYGADYELIYLHHKSEEWLDIHHKWFEKSAKLFAVVQKCRKVSKFKQALIILQFKISNSKILLWVWKSWSSVTLQSRVK